MLFDAKQNLQIIIALFFLAFSQTSAAAALTGCAAKKQEIQTQLDYAKSHNNQNQIHGLEKALTEVQDHCTDESLLKERTAKVNEKKEKVNERLAELQEAKEIGRLDKISKKQKKLEDAQEELKEAQRALSQ